MSFFHRFQWVRNAALHRAQRRDPGALILLYHRVASLSTDPQLLAVTPARFAEHLAILQKLAHPVALAELPALLRENRLPPRAVVVTFDDGYADNFEHAEPLLRRAGIPATIFTSTGWTDTDVEFWWDELDRIFLQPGTLPVSLKISVNGQPLEWDFRDCADYSVSAFTRHAGWNVLVKDDPTPRHHAFRTMSRHLRPLLLEDRNAILAELRAGAGLSVRGRAENRAMRRDELRKLSEGGLIEIGAHTVSHPVLSSLGAERQWLEIAGNRDALTLILGNQPRTFSYPFGGASDYSLDSVRAAREAGFTVACANFPGLARRDGDPWQLPRILVRNWSGEEFTRRLRRWLFGVTGEN